MNLLQTIWSVLTTPNMQMANYIAAPLIFVEAYVTMLLFTSVFNIETTRKTRLIYVFVFSLCGLVNRFIVPTPYSTILNMLIMPITIFLILKTSISKSIIVAITQFLIVALLETLVVKCYSMLFNISYDNIASIPANRIFSTLFIYIIIFLIYILLNRFKFNTNILDFFDNLSKKSKFFLLIDLILAITTIIIQFYVIVFYLDYLSTYVAIFSMIILISYTIISFYTLVNTTKLEIANRDLEESRMYNKTLGILHDNIRGFKHDFGNIVQTIGGYVTTEDIKGLKKYYSQLLEDCQRVNNLAALNPTTINNPAIYSLLASKYYIANEQGININLEVFLDLNEINMKIYEFTRVLGILLDNAIEASSQCNEKIINISFRNNEKKNMQEIIIQNTYNNKDINIDEIFQKGYTSKTSENKSSHGLGLWEIRQILKKRNNLNLYTTKSEKYFTQQLEIYL